MNRPALRVIRTLKKTFIRRAQSVFQQTVILLLLVFALVACAPTLKGGQENPDINGVKYRLALNRAVYLENEIAILEQTTPKTSPASSWRINRNRRKLAGMVNRLNQCGRWALANNDKNLAGQCLRLSATIKPSAATRSMLEDLKSAAPPPQRPGPAAVGSEEKIKSALRQGRLETAVESAAAGQAMGLGLSHDLAEQLKRRVEAKTRVLLKKARDLYSSGAINDAGKLWRKVIAVDPGNQEAVNSLARLKKVRWRLKKLREH